MFLVVIISPSLTRACTNVQKTLSSQYVVILALRESQRTRDIYPILDQCWTNDGPPSTTLAQYWVDVLCLLGFHRLRLKGLYAYIKISSDWSQIKQISVIFHRLVGVGRGSEIQRQMGVVNCQNTRDIWGPQNGRPPTQIFRPIVSLHHYLVRRFAPN